MMYLRYYHEFYDVEQNLYRVEILQESEAVYTPQWIELSSDPLQIEWGEVDKLEPVMSSSATLRLVSMTDRQFVDMYTVAIGAIRMDVYRNGALYWSGTLDAELFEEPYSLRDRYVTECTFSDFAVLRRISWQEKGLSSIRAVIDSCLLACKIKYSQVVTHISTSIPDNTANILDGCALSLENFYDEDGESWNMRDVLDEVLRPFALRLKQKNGEVFISDINAVSTLDTTPVEWRGANAVLGVEPTYNKVSITFSPYSDSAIFDGTFDEEKILPNITAVGVTQISVPVPDTDFLGFSLYVSPEYPALTNVQKMLIGNGARLYRIKPDNDGSESAGVLWGARPVGDHWYGKAPFGLTVPIYGQDIIMQTPRLPILQGSSEYRLKIAIDVLYDPRMNPFEPASRANEEGNWDDFKNWANYGGIAAEITLYGYDGKVYKCDNRGLFSNARVATWHEAVEGSKYRVMLMWYNEGDRKSDTGFGGWQTNKQHIDFYDGELPRETTFSIEGEKIKMPPVAGELEVAIYSGVMAMDNKSLYDYPDVAGISRWLLYKDLKVTVTGRSGKDITSEDVVISAWINKAAEEELPIDTFVGTATSRIPLAKGVIISQDNYQPISKFSRAGVTDSIERLLAGTVYSNYADRVSTLSGTIRLIAAEKILSDNSAVNSRFLVLSEVQNIAEATSDIKMAEIKPDDYQSVEYEGV